LISGGSATRNRASLVAAQARLLLLLLLLMPLLRALLQQSLRVQQEQWGLPQMLCEAAMQRLQHQEKKSIEADRGSPSSAA
jgi:hypothetical protein